MSQAACKIQLQVNEHVRNECIIRLNQLASKALNAVLRCPSLRFASCKLHSIQFHRGKLPYSMVLPGPKHPHDFRPVFLPLTFCPLVVAAPPPAEARPASCFPVMTGCAAACPAIERYQVQVLFPVYRREQNQSIMQADTSLCQIHVNLLMIQRICR